MFLFILRLIVKSALSLRYRIRVTGLESCVARGTKGVLFLPNHPALIDPVILSTVLYPAFRPRPLVNEKQVRASALKYIADRIRLLCLPDMEIAGKAGRAMILKQIDACVAALRSGDNLMFYPAGRIYRCRRENLRGNGGVSRILEAYPEVRIVLVRTRGLWGSEFSRGKGYQISFGECIHRHLWHVLVNLIFFMPRRPVDIELVEAPADLPRNREKDVLNRYLEVFYNKAETGNIYVPYCWYERGGIRCLPDPDGSRPVDDTADISEEIKNEVFARLHAVVDKKIIKNLDMLATDLALDHGQVEELCRWIEQRFKVKIEKPDSLKTVYSLLMAAAGEKQRAEILKPVDPVWFLRDDSAPAQVMVCDNIAECLIQRTRENPDCPVVADQERGVMTCRQIMKNVLELKPLLEKTSGRRVALSMPAGCMQTVFYLGLVLAGKIPVLIPWNADSKVFRHCMEKGECRTAVLERSMLERLRAAGVPDGEELVCAGEFLDSLQPMEQLCATMQTLLSWLPLGNSGVAELAAVLFVDNGQALPEMMTLPHRSVREYLQTAVRQLALKEDSCLMHVSGPLSIFYFLTNMILPFCSRVRLVYPGAGGDCRQLARLAAAYDVTVMCGAGRDLARILGTAEKVQLKTLEMIVTGQGQASQIPHEKAQKLGLSPLAIQEFPFIG